jgi:hypothetical protein
MRASSDITKNSWGLLVDVLRVDSGRVTAQLAITGRVLTNDTDGLATTLPELTGRYGIGAGNVPQGCSRQPKIMTRRIGEHWPTCWDSCLKRRRDRDLPTPGNRFSTWPAKRPARARAALPLMR